MELSDVLPYIVSVVSFLITGLLSLVIFFMKRALDAFQKTVDEHTIELAAVKLAALEAKHAHTNKVHALELAAANEKTSQAVQFVFKVEWSKDYLTLMSKMDALHRRIDEMRDWDPPTGRHRMPEPPPGRGGPG